MTKRKNVYQQRGGGNRRPPAPGSDASVERPNLATINSQAVIGRAGFRVGDRVRIEGSGMFAGEAAVIEKLVGSVIPSALVRTESGGTRQARTIDLVPLAAEPKSKAASEASPQPTPES